MRHSDQNGTMTVMSIRVMPPGKRWLASKKSSPLVIPNTLFNERKAAQAAAFLLYRAGGELPLLKLLKLMYLAERESLRQYGDTITGDSFVSMNQGPVLSMTYEYINGGIQSAPDGWSSWISDRAEHNVALRDPSRIRSPEQDLLALSDTDMECLDVVWKQFGHIDRWALVRYTHSSACPEWEDPHGSSRPIPMGRLLKALGYKPTEAAAIIKRQHEQRYIQSSFSQASQ